MAALYRGGTHKGGNMLKVTISVVGSLAKIEVELPDSATVEVDESAKVGQPTIAAKPHNPATDLSKPYPIVKRETIQVEPKVPAATQVAVEPPATPTEAPAGGEPEAPTTVTAGPLHKADLARAWGKSVKKGPRTKAQQAEDTAWVAAGSPATEEVLDAHGKPYRTNPDGTAHFATEEVTEEDVSANNGQAQEPDILEAARQAKLDEDFGPVPVAISDEDTDEFGEPIAKVATKSEPKVAPVAVSQDTTGVPPEVFEAVEVRDILKPLAAAKLTKAQILGFLEANHAKLKPLARMPLEAMLPRMARALDTLKVV